jgi:predicted CoA-substrate-specific enzyme activase
MIVAGVDIGAATAKALILGDGHILGYSIVPTGSSVKVAAEKVLDEALEKASLPRSAEELDCIVSTGYGRNAFTLARKSVTEIICHAKGAHFLIPETRTIIDIGGQDSKGISIDENGNVRDFVMNDKCAAGSGRFLEVMAAVLEVGSIDRMGSLSLQGKACRISSICTIFAESEVISLRAEGRSKEDLIAGVHKAIATRVAAMIRRIKIRDQLVFTGGVAKNIGVTKALEEALRTRIVVPDEPQIIGALGAAILAAETV